MVEERWARLVDEMPYDREGFLDVLYSVVAVAHRRLAYLSSWLECEHPERVAAQHMFEMQRDVFNAIGPLIKADWRSNASD